MQKAVYYIDMLHSTPLCKFMVSDLRGLWKGEATEIKFKSYCVTREISVQISTIGKELIPELLWVVSMNNL